MHMDLSNHDNCSLCWITNKQKLSNITNKIYEHKFTEQELCTNFVLPKQEQEQKQQIKQRNKVPAMTMAMEARKIGELPVIL